MDRQSDFQQFRTSQAFLLVAATALACLAAGLFHPILGFEFVNVDVIRHVVKNPDIRGLSPENLRRILTTRSTTTSYYPVRTLSYAVDYQLWGLNPAGFKLTNLAIHVANVLLVFWLALRVGRRVGSAGGFIGDGWQIFAAALATAVFAVHPVVVEPVTWVPGREELLMTLGALGCWHCHMTAWQRWARGSKRRAVAWHLGAAASCGAGCLSNAVGAIIPALIVAWDVVDPGWASGRESGTAGAMSVARRRTWWHIFWGSFLLWVMAVATVVSKRIGESVDPYRPPFGVFTPQRLQLVLHIYWLNLKTLFWPARLAVDYWGVKVRGFGDPPVVLGAVAVLLSLAAVWAARRRTVVLFGLLWFGLALAPTSQIMPHHLARADRFLYLPLVGLALALAGLLWLAARRFGGRVGRAAVAVALLVALAALARRSAGQLLVWKDSIALWENCVRVVPDNPYAHDCLAEVLADAGRLAEAIPHYEQAIRLAPDDLNALNHFAYRLAVTDQVELRDYDRAIALARRALRLPGGDNPKVHRTLALAYMNRATAWRRAGRYEEAVRGYEDAMAADPTDERPRFNLALLLATCPDATCRRPEEAVRLAEEAMTLVDHPGPTQFVILAQVYAAVGRTAEAAAAIGKAIAAAEDAGDREMADQLRRWLAEYEPARAGGSGSSRE